MLSLSHNYLHSIIKKYDGIARGSSSLWGARMTKAYGILSKGLDHHINDNIHFDYNNKQISIARRLRIGYYERLITVEDIINNLKPLTSVVIDVEIFDSIFNDQDGNITMPDEDEDKKEEYSHSFTVSKYDSRNNNFIVNSSGWNWWGKNGDGTMPLEYLQKYLIGAYVTIGMPRLSSEIRNCLLKKKVILNNKKYYSNLFLESNFCCDKKQRLNFEIINSGGDLIGWAHFSFNNDNRIIDMLDIFVLNEYRNNGIGSYLIKEIMNFTKAKILTGYISSYDLIKEREEVVKSFLLKNNLTVSVDRSQFKNCRLKIINI